jgi:hypothetical protein
VKYLAKTFTLPDVQVGGIIEYSYTVDLGEYMLFDSHWILSDDLFTKKAQFSLKPYRGTYELWSLRWSWNVLPAGTVSPKQGSDGTVRMEAANIPAFQTEDYMPLRMNCVRGWILSMSRVLSRKTKPVTGGASGKNKTDN